MCILEFPPAELLHSVRELAPKLPHCTHLRIFTDADVIAGGLDSAILRIHMSEGVPKNGGLVPDQGPTLISLCL